MRNRPPQRFLARAQSDRLLPMPYLDWAAHLRKDVQAAANAVGAQDLIAVGDCIAVMFPQRCINHRHLLARCGLALGVRWRGGGLVIHLH